MLELVAEEVAHVEVDLVIRQGSGATPPFVAHVDVQQLAVELAPHGGVAHDLVAVVFEAQVLGFRLLHLRRAREAWIEHIEREAPAGCQVTAHARQTGQLVLDRVHVLERAKRREDQREAVVAQVEALHRSAHEPERLGRGLRAKRPEHRGRCVDACARNAERRDRKQGAARSAAELEHGPGGLARQLQVELGVRAQPGARIGGVVVARGDGSVAVAHNSGRWTGW